MKILLGDFNAKVGREIIFKPTIGQESLHQDSNDNGVRLVNFATSKNLVVKSTMFRHRNIHKYTWTSPDGKTTVLSVLCVMFQVQLSFVVNLSNVFLVQFPNVSLSFSLLFH